MKKLIGIAVGLFLLVTPAVARPGGGHGGGHGGYHVGGGHGGYHGSYRGGYGYRGGYRGYYGRGYGYYPWIGLGVGAAIIGGAIAAESCWQYVLYPDQTLRRTWVCN